MSRSSSGRVQARLCLCWDSAARWQEGVRQAVAQQGLLGAFTGGVRAAAGGISAAVFFGLCTAILFQPADKS